jgi:ribosomal protein S18 acetylase RimI-like enzyme
MEFRIRAGTSDDWLAYRDIRLRMLQEAPDAYGSSYAREADFSESTWRERAAHPMLVLAVNQNEEIVGTATGLTAEDGTVEVVAMYVAPDARGQGCAGQLLDAVAAAARQRGTHRLVLRVTRDNRAASRCYTRYGFRPTGRAWPMERKPELFEVELAMALGRDH